MAPTGSAPNNRHCAKPCPPGLWDTHCLFSHCPGSASSDCLTDRLEGTRRKCLLQGKLIVMPVSGFRLGPAAPAAPGRAAHMPSLPGPFTISATSPKRCPCWALSGARNDWPMLCQGGGQDTRGRGAGSPLSLVPGVPQIAREQKVS